MGSSIDRKGEGVAYPPLLVHTWNFLLMILIGAWKENFERRKASAATGSRRCKDIIPDVRGDNFTPRKRGRVWRTRSLSTAMIYSVFLVAFRHSIASTQLILTFSLQSPFLGSPTYSVMVPRKTNRIARQQWHRHLSILHLSYGDVLPGKHDPEPKQGVWLCHMTSRVLGLVSRETLQDLPKIYLESWANCNCNIGIISEKGLAPKRL